jgi:hypothetical protein
MLESVRRKVVAGKQLFAKKDERGLRQALTAALVDDRDEFMAVVSGVTLLIDMGDSVGL